jgi:hypothetical protein
MCVVAEKLDLLREIIAFKESMLVSFSGGLTAACSLRSPEMFSEMERWL